MKKRLGFTLIELLAAVSLLTFVIMLSHTLFDNAIQESYKLQPAVENTSKGNSIIENSIGVAREYYDQYYKDNTKVNLKPISIDTAGLKLSSMSSGGVRQPEKKINKVEGYIVSVAKGSSIAKINNLEKDDIAYTFVGIGHFSSPVSYVKEMYMDHATSQSRYRYLKASGENINSSYKIENINNTFKKARIRYLVSPTSEEDIIYTPYIDAYKDALSLSNDKFNYIGNDFNSEKLSGTFSYSIKPYLTDKQSYIDAMDKDFAVNGITFNSNGDTSSESSSFANNNSSKHNIIHTIGLPIINNLVAHYDANLTVTSDKSKPNLYYSLFDKTNNTNIDRKFQNIMQEKNITLNKKSSRESMDVYSFDWNSFDIRNFTGIDNGVSVSDNIMPEGFVDKINSTNADGVSEILPNNKKPYGTTVYYDLGNNSVNLPTNFVNMTAIIKYNAHNFSENKSSSSTSISYPYVLLSYNFNEENGELIDNTKDGFAIYVDEMGNIRENKITKPSPDIAPGKYEDRAVKIAGKDLNINEDFNIYKDIKNYYKFSKLKYTGKIADKRDDRQDFHIIAVNVAGNNIKLYVLETEISAGKLQTNAKLIKEINAGSSDVLSGTLRFGKLIKNVKNTDLSGADTAITVYNDNSSMPVMEISDLIIYDRVMPSTNKVVMDYLYRRYLTEKERKESKYDENYRIN